MRYTKIRILGLNLLVLLALASCIDDKGNYDYLPEEEVLPGSISGLEENYDVLFGETVHFEAKVEGAENRENIRYMWYLYAYPNERTRDTLGYGLSLDWHVEQSTGTYYLWFEARDTITDVCVNKRADITIGTPLSDAWLIVETTDGMTDLDAITSGGELMEDLVTGSTGTRLQGNAIKVVYCQQHSNEIENADGTVDVEKYKVFYLLSENEIQIFNAENMELLKKTEDCFYETPETVHPENCFVNTRDVCLINAGQYYYFSGMSANVGKFPNAVFGVDGAEYHLHHEVISAGQQYLLWDKISQSFLWANMSDALYTFDDAPEEGGGYGSPTEMNANLLHLLYRSSVYNWDTYSSTYNAYAIDYDGDGRADVWDSFDDAIASAANYLHSLGWKTNEPWGGAVSLPWNFNYTDTGLKNTKTVAEWKAIGVRKSNGKALSWPNNLQGSIIIPDGRKGAAYMVFGNFKRIMIWNRSESYALTIGLLADYIKNNQPYSPIKSEQQYVLTNQEVKKVQNFANRILHTNLKEDGILGPKTKQAIKQLQKKAGMHQDGYPDYQLLNKINTYNGKTGFNVPPQPRKKIKSNNINKD